jgi:chromosome segregation ATPase
MTDGIRFAAVLCTNFREFLVPLQNDLQSPRSLSQSKLPQKSKGELVALPAAPSFSLDEASTIVEIEVRADQLLNYIDKLTSFADRACSAAIRQTETAHRIEENRFTEIADLRRTLEHQNAKLQEQQLAMVRLEQQSKVQITALEVRLRQNEMQRAEEKRQDLLRGENAGLVSRLKEAEALVLQAQERNHDWSEPLGQELEDLKLQLAERDETIQAKSATIKHIESDSRAKILDIEQRLRDAEKALEDHEAILKEKDAVIRATALKEAEMGNLIKRLSAECAKLSNELQERTRTPSQNHGTHAEPRADVNIWRRVIGRLQEDPQ